MEEIEPGEYYSQVSLVTHKKKKEKKRDITHSDVSFKKKTYVPVRDNYILV